MKVFTLHSLTPLQIQVCVYHVKCDVHIMGSACVYRGERMAMGIQVCVYHIMGINHMAMGIQVCVYHNYHGDSLVPRLSKAGGGKESLVHTVCACAKFCTRLARAMTFYDVLVTFDRVLTSALIDF